MSKLYSVERQTATNTDVVYVFYNFYYEKYTNVFPIHRKGEGEGEGVKLSFHL
jgi:hypothetical protein